jgi:hypothetical protein
VDLVVLLEFLRIVDELLIVAKSAIEEAFATSAKYFTFGAVMATRKCFFLLQLFMLAEI